MQRRKTKTASFSALGIPSDQELEAFEDEYSRLHPDEEEPERRSLSRSEKRAARRRRRERRRRIDGMMMEWGDQGQDFAPLADDY